MTMQSVQQTIETDKQETYHPFASCMRLCEEEYVTFTTLKKEELFLFLSILQEGVEKLGSGEKIKKKESGQLLNAMLLLAYHRCEEAFHPFLQLKNLDEEYLISTLGENFLFEDWPRLLAATAAGQWKLIRDIIDQDHVSENILSSLITCITKMVLIEDVDRTDVIAWLQSRLNRFAKVEGESSERVSDYIFMADDLWPGECLEEIRELFGLRMVNNWDISIDDVLKTYGKEMEEVLSCGRKSFLTAPFISLTDPDVSEEELAEERFQKLNSFFKELNTIEDKDPLETFRKSQRLTAGRNDPCRCGSGKKFKKCCLTQQRKAPPALKRITMEITCEPLEDIRKQYDPEDALEIERMYNDLREEPGAFIAPLKMYIAKYPDNPALYNYLYQCLVLEEELKEAHQLLLKTVEKFPDYLFGLVEYAMYFLRRSELEKFDKVIKKSRTLNALYPEREVFHISEVLLYNHAMGIYFLKLGDVKQADIYLGILEQLDPESENAVQLKIEIEQYLRRKNAKSLFVNPCD